MRAFVIGGKMKKCSRCGEVKPYDMYYKCSRLIDGYMGYCKSCHNKNLNNNTILYDSVVAGQTYKNTLGEEFIVDSIDGNNSYIYFNELLHGKTTIDRIKYGKVYKNERSGDIRVRLEKGQKVGYLTVLESTRYSKSDKVLTQCDCGRVKKVAPAALAHKGTVSCGCRLSKESIKHDYFLKAMQKWNPTTHRTDVKKLPIFNINRDSGGCSISGWTYVDEYTYNSLKDCMLIKSTYVQLGLDKYNSEILGIRYDYKNGSIPLHCWVKAMPTGVKDLMTDHKNGCKLDNRPSNLRIVDCSQNSANSKAASKVGYKGVYVLKGSTKGKLIKNIKAQGWIPNTSKSKFLGKYHTVEEAAKAVDIWNIQNYGEFARLNLKRSIYEDMGLLPKIVKSRGLP